MKLPLSGYVLGRTTDTLIRSLTRILPQFASQINAASEGRIAGAYNALEQPPTQGLYAQGDYIRNLTPTVQGSAGSRYVVRGWICVNGGEPGTWAEDRGLTGT